MYGGLHKLPICIKISVQLVFKTAIDIAAEITKDRSSQISIIFGGSGFVLVDEFMNREEIRCQLSQSKY